MITINDSAKSRLLDLMKEENKSGESFVRVGVKGGGCSGLLYDLSFDTVMKDDDKVFEDKGMRIVVDKKSVLYLAGTELDYSGGLNGKGFSF